MTFSSLWSLAGAISKEHTARVTEEHHNIQLINEQLKQAGADEEMRAEIIRNEVQAFNARRSSEHRAAFWWLMIVFALSVLVVMRLEGFV
jgi:hypothetical protein